jgi:hypothetical protein
VTVRHSIIDLAFLLSTTGALNAQLPAPDAQPPATADRTIDTRDDDFSNWGWLGLLGLIGLARLLGEIVPWCEPEREFSLPSGCHAGYVGTADCTPRSLNSRPKW